MSDETTPRPWAHVRNVYEGLSAVEIGDDCHGAMRPADADLIVTAVNQHDALVAFAERVRATCNSPEFAYKVRGDFDTYDQWHEGASDALGRIEGLLADLDAQIGGN